MKILNNILLVLIAVSALWFSSCRIDDTVPLKGNPSVTDSTALMQDRDIFISYRVDEDSEDGYNVFRVQNRRSRFVSEAMHFRPGLCEHDPMFDTTWKYTEVERLLFHDTTVREDEIEIELTRCIDQVLNEEEHDSIMFMTGDWPYLTLSDSASGAQLRFRDNEGTWWSSKRAQRTVDDRFRISAVIDNDLNNKYRYIVFGEFRCNVKARGSNETKKITRGRFKMFARKL